MVLLIDNYDSFSYNLYQLIGSFRQDIQVVRNDEMTINEIQRLAPDHIILSPGPGFPKDAGVCVEAAKQLGQKIPLLGVCLGHQSICEAFGAKVSYAGHLMHGKQSEVKIDTNCPIFKGMNETIRAARYHSLAAVRESVPDCLKITAESDDGEIMAVMHREYPVYGVQFHPESILTPQGNEILERFLFL